MKANNGKGNVVRTMFREVEADIYIMVDGDDTYPAKAVHKLLQPVLNEEYDMVVGDRVSNGTYSKQMKRRFHKFGNLLVRKIINLLFKNNLKDIFSGYRAFSKRFVKNMPVMCDKFEFETEATLFALDKDFRIMEIPVEFKDRPKGSKSKLKTIPDGMSVISTILKMFKDYKPFTFFTIIFLILLISGILVGLPVIIEFIKTHYITKVPSAVLATGLIILSVISEQCGIILHSLAKQNKENYELNLVHYLEKKDD